MLTSFIQQIYVEISVICNYTLNYGSSISTFFKLNMTFDVVLSQIN